MKKVDKDVEDKLEKKLLLNPTLEDIIKFLDGKIETIIRRTTDNMLVEDFTKTKENIGEKINWKKEKLCEPVGRTWDEAYETIIGGVKESLNRFWNNVPDEWKN